MKIFDIRGLSRTYPAEAFMAGFFFWAGLLHHLRLVRMGAG